MASRGSHFASRLIKRPAGRDRSHPFIGTWLGICRGARDPCMPRTVRGQGRSAVRNGDVFVATLALICVALLSLFVAILFGALLELYRDVRQLRDVAGILDR